jgi:hypothetical protein
MSLVRVAHFADAALELHAAALLNNVRRFMRDRVKVGSSAEHDMIAGGVCVRSDRVG